MIVNMYEPSGFNRAKDWVKLNPEGTVLQVQENILNQLNYEQNFENKQFALYCTAMQKVHENLFDGGSNVIPVEHTALDTFYSSLGVDTSDYKIINGGSKYA